MSFHMGLLNNSYLNSSMPNNAFSPLNEAFFKSLTARIEYFEAKLNAQDEINLNLAKKMEMLSNSVKEVSDENKKMMYCLNAQDELNSALSKKVNKLSNSVKQVSDENKKMKMMLETYLKSQVDARPGSAISSSSAVSEHKPISSSSLTSQAKVKEKSKDHLEQLKEDLSKVLLQQGAPSDDQSKHLPKAQASNSQLENPSDNDDLDGTSAFKSLCNVSETSTINSSAIFELDENEKRWLEEQKFVGDNKSGQIAVESDLKSTELAEQKQVEDTYKNNDFSSFEISIETDHPTSESIQSSKTREDDNVFEPEEGELLSDISSVEARLVPNDSHFASSQPPIIIHSPQTFIKTHGIDPKQFAYGPLEVKKFGPTGKKTVFECVYLYKYDAESKNAIPVAKCKLIFDKRSNNSIKLTFEKIDADSAGEILEFWVSSGIKAEASKMKSFNNVVMWKCFTDSSYSSDRSQILMAQFDKDSNADQFIDLFEA